MAQKNNARRGGQLRIIGGNWRGRKLNFPDVTGLRPTADRIRETVFNWLQNDIGDASCLDLFAGSGALGFEAASRGAESVDMVELDTSAYRQLQQNKTLLNAEQCQLHHTHAQPFIARTGNKYDVVFIDPPYQADLWSEVAELLMTHGRLNASALIYMEWPSKTDLPLVPQSWQLIKDKKAGDVRYCLFEFRQEHAGSE